MGKIGSPKDDAESVSERQVGDPLGARSMLSGMAEPPRQVIRGPDGQPYSPGTITETVYVLKSTDQWLPDEGPDGVIWSGGRGQVKRNQHPARYILDTDGAVLRLPLAGGKDQSVLVEPKKRMTGRRAKRRTQRQAQLIACAQAAAELAEHREIQPLRVHDVEHDLEIHAVLGAIVRRWKTPASYISTAAVNMPREELHLEHVVPIRVLVDRMIRDPTECQELLETAVVIARVTAAEHRELGGIFSHHPELYGRMLTAPVSELPNLGWERYRGTSITVQPTS